MLVYGQRPAGSFPLGAVPDGSLVGGLAQPTASGGDQIFIWGGRSSWAQPAMRPKESDADIILLCSIFLEVIQ